MPGPHRTLRIVKRIGSVKRLDTRKLWLSQRLQNLARFAHCARDNLSHRGVWVWIAKTIATIMDESLGFKHDRTPFHR